MTLRVRHPATLVFALFASLYLLTYKGVSAGDDLYHLVAMKGWLHGRLSLPEALGTGLPRGPHGFFVASGRDGRPQLSLPPGLALLSLPLGGIGEQMDDGPDGDASAELAGLSLVRAPAEDVARALRRVRERPFAFCAGLVNPIVTAATVTLFFVVTLWLGATPRAALASTLLLGIATIVWPYATSYWSQPIAGFCLLATFAGLLRFEQTGRLGPLAWAGLACGYGVLTRTELLLAVPWAALYLWLAVRARPGMRSTAVAAFAAPLVACALLWAGWNWIRFGDWLQAGSIHQRAFLRSLRPATLLLSVPAQLLSFQRSLFVFSPPLLLALAAWPSFRRRHRTFGTIVAGVVATFFVFYSGFIMWSAPASWGPRFLVPLTALLMLPVGAWLEGSTRRVRMAIALGGVGALVQLAVALPGYSLDAVAAYWTSGPRTLTALLLKSDLVPELRLLLRGELDVWWLWNPGAMVAASVLAAIATSAGIGLRTAVMRED